MLSRHTRDSSENTMSLFMKLPDAGVMRDGYVTLPIKMTSS